MDSSAVDDDNVSFHLGEMFNSYEELENKLEKFSKRSLVHYWRRDSRTVSGAHMKTARPISERLKYYSVKYACIYGGQKFLPRGAGRRQSQSIRTNCPAHIMLRASKDGTKLEVTSVNNEHNHEISEELFKKLPQERKLCGEIKQEVQDLMQLHIDRKRLKEYVRLRTNKILRSKDLFNIAAANKQKREITPERAYQLFKRIHDLEKLQGRDSGRKTYSESEDEISQRIKRIKKDHHHESPWGQDGLSAELDVSEGNDGDDSYGAQLTQEEVVGDLNTNQGQLLRANNEGNIITANGEIVCELVMENGDPSVIVESIVNTDGSVFEDEREFNNYCDNHLTHSVHDSQSPGSHVLDIETIPTPVEIQKISKPSPSPSTNSDPLASGDPLASKICNVSQKNDGMKTEKIWLKEPINPESEADSSPESESGLANTSKNVTEENNELGDVVFSEEASHQLLHEQLAVLRAEKSKLRAEESKIRAEESKIRAEESKLFHEIEMLKLKKEKIKLQMSYYSNENRKEEKEKDLRFEKLRLKIKLLQSKVVEDNGEVSHYIFVP